MAAATRAGALDPAGLEALLRYVLRPPVAQERAEQRAFGLVRITLKKAYTDGTIAVDMDPLSLLCRLATSMPPPRLHTIRYAGVLAPASVSAGSCSAAKRALSRLADRLEFHQLGIGGADGEVGDVRFDQHRPRRAVV